MVQITKASQDLASLNLLVYADSGAGKTVFAASAPRVLFVAPEDTGIVSAVNLGYDPDKITVRTWSDFVRAYEYCYDNADELAKKYDWIAIDSVTKMQEICMTELIESQADQRKAKDQDPDLPQIQDYQKLYILVERLILAFNDLPINVIYTALAWTKEDPDGDEFLLPMIGSNRKDDSRVSMKCASHMTSFGYFKVEVVEKPAPTPDDPKKTKKVRQRVIYWEDTGVYRGKDRTTRLTPKTVLPNKNALDFVSKVIKGTLDREGKPLNQNVRKVAAKKAAPPVESPKDKLARNDSDPISAVNDAGPEPKGENQAEIELASVEA
jgi:AAA domain